MKKLLPTLVLLTACSSELAENPTHNAVSDFVKTKLDDPASYQSVGWIREQPYTAANQSHDQAKNLQLAAAAQASLAMENQRLVYQLSGNSLPEAQRMKAEKKKLSDAYSRKSDSLTEAAKGLFASTDTTRIGWMLTHSYRAKNKTGGLELDSGQFVILPGAKVTRR